MASIDGGAILINALQKAGVQQIFSLSGAGMASVYRSAASQGVRVIHTRHEGPAAFMADAWARATGQPGICLVTHGVGLTNASTGIAAAWLDQSPMIAMALAPARSRVDMGNLQEIDQLSVMRPITKWAARVPEAKRIPEYLARAARHALAGPPGPTFLELPVDVLAEEVDEGTVTYHPWPALQAPVADQTLIERAAELIAQAERPILVAGSGVRWSEGGETLQALAEVANLPTFSRRLAWSQMPLDHPLHFGAAWFPLSGVFTYAAARCDLMLMIAGRLFYDLEHGRSPLLNRNTKIVQIDIDSTNLGHNRPAAVGIQADARCAMIQLAEALKTMSGKNRWSAWIEDLKTRRAESRAELEKYFHADGSPIHPLRLWAEISRVLPAESLLVVGQGDSDYWAEPILPICRRGNYLRAGRSGCLGAEIPFGIAAKLARPNTPVVVTAGDGGFGFSAMELDTAVRYNAPIIVILSNDGRWNMIKAQVTSMYGEAADAFLDLLPHPYHVIAQALGGYGEEVTEPEQVGPAFLRALNSGKVSVLNVRIRPFTSPLCRWLSQNQRYPIELIGYPS